MAKPYLFLMLFSLAIIAHGDDDTLLQKFSDEKKKVTELQVYVQDVFSSPTPSNVIVARANSTFRSPTFFGLVTVIDDPVRTAPTPESELVGQVSGFYAFSSLEEICIHMTVDIVFTGGEYNGSVLNLVGRNPYPQNFRQLSIVGGLGAFLLARGFVDITTVSTNATTGDAFFQYNITILHYQ